MWEPISLKIRIVQNATHPIACECVSGKISNQTCLNSESVTTVLREGNPLS